MFIKLMGTTKFYPILLDIKLKRKFDNDLSKLVKWFDTVKKDRYF